MLPGDPTTFLRLFILPLSWMNISHVSSPYFSKMYLLFADFLFLLFKKLIDFTSFEQLYVYRKIKQKVQSSLILPPTPVIYLKTPAFLTCRTSCSLGFADWIPTVFVCQDLNISL